MQAQEQLERLQNNSQDTAQAPEKGHPGRGVNAHMTLEQAKQVLDTAHREHVRLAQQRQ